MKKIEIYDPAMCCSTGVCGPGVDPELLRVATVVDSLCKQGVDIKRHNLANEPQAFVNNPVISKLLNEDNDVLPVTLVDGEVVKTKAHLTNEEFEKYAGLTLGAPAAPQGGCCCGDDSDCC